MNDEGRLRMRGCIPAANKSQSMRVAFLRRINSGAKPVRLATRVTAMDAIILQILNGLDKGGAYALIALGLTLVFGTLGVVNFAHGALFMLGASAPSRSTSSDAGKGDGDPTQLTPGDACGNQDLAGGSLARRVRQGLVNYSVPFSIIAAIPVMLIIGIVMERGLIRHFYKRPHADQILVTFGLAIVIQEIIKHFYGANPIPQAAPAAFSGTAQVGMLLGMGDAIPIRGGG